MTDITTLAAEDQNILFPAMYDIVGSAVIFVILVIFFWKVILPKVQKTLDERSAAIEGAIEEASQAKAEAAEALQSYNDQLAEARAEAAKIREDARIEGGQILAELKSQANDEAARMIAAAQTQIEADRKTAFEQLKGEIGVLALDLASSVVGESMADDSKSTAVVDRFLKQLDETDKAGAAK